MRTTVDLPDELMRAAKARAAERGQSLKELFAGAVAHELGAVESRRPQGRVALPLIGSKQAAKVELDNADLEAALADDDAGYARR